MHEPTDTSLSTPPSSYSQSFLACDCGPAVLTLVGPVGGEDREPVVALELGEHHVDTVRAGLAGHEDGLALVEEEDGVVDLGLTEDELDDRARLVVPQVWEVDLRTGGDGRERD
jgi:hypothetical protein